MTRSRMSRATGVAPGRVSRASACFAAFDCLGFIAEAPHHGLQKAALDGIVVGNQNRGGHGVPGPGWQRAVRVMFLQPIVCKTR